MKRWSSLVLLLLVTPVAPVHAQRAADRLTLRIFRDSIASVGDSLQLLRLEQRTIDIARVQREDALLHLRLGFIAMRLGEVTGQRSHFDDGAGEFEWAGSIHPDWPYPWYGLGLAEARLPDRARTSFGALMVMLGQDRNRLAGSAFGRAVALDPSFTEALAEFAQTVLDERIDAPLDQAISALRSATATPVGWDPHLLLLLGRLERLAGNADSARADFSRAQQLALRPAVALLELARTLALTADTVAPAKGEPNPVERAYFAAAESDEAEVVEMLRRDLSPITDDGVLAGFDSTSGTARGAWLRRFWSVRDGADLRPPGSRLVEHYRRWFRAMKDFRLPPFRRLYRYGIELYQSRDVDFDDRGVVLIRHGIPSRRIVWPRSLVRRGTDEPPDWGDETWRYIRPDGDLVLHFAAHDDVGDFRLVESIFNLGMSFDAMVSRSRDLPGLNRMLHAGPNTARLLREEERLKSRKDIRAATSTDSWVRSYDRPVSGRAALLAVGTEQGKPLVHIVYSVDAVSVRRLGAGGTVPVTVRAAFLDAKGVPVATLDTVQRVRPPDAATGTMVTLRAEVTVPPGTRKIRLGVELSPSVGSLFATDSVVVPQVDGTRLDLSSLVVGAASHGLPWKASSADTVWFDGTGVYTPSDTVVVYAEAYGVRPGAGYSAKLSIVRQRGAIARLFSGQPTAVAIKDESRFEGTIGRFRRSVDLHGLEPGNYTVQLTVEGPNGKEVRARGITIRPEKELVGSRKAPDAERVKCFGTAPECG